MKKVKEILVDVCDNCGGELPPYSAKYVPCPICDKDLCEACAANVAFTLSTSDNLYTSWKYYICRDHLPKELLALAEVGSR